MKNILKILTVSFFLTGVMISCNEDDYAERNDDLDLGGYAYLNDQSISSFDRGVDLNIGLFTQSGVTFTSIDVDSDGTSASATISGDMATVNNGFLGDVESDDSYDLLITSQLSNGKTAKDLFTLDVVSPVSIESELSEATLDTLPNITITYETYTLSATIDNVNLAIKKNMDGTYTDAGVTSLPVDGGDVVVEDTNYTSLTLAEKDTLYYKFTVTSGMLSEEAESYIAIVPED